MTQKQVGTAQEQVGTTQEQVGTTQEQVGTVPQTDGIVGEHEIQGYNYGRSPNQPSNQPTYHAGENHV